MKYGREMKGRDKRHVQTHELRQRDHEARKGRDKEDTDTITWAIREREHACGVR